MFTAPCAAGSYSVEGVGTCAECEKGSYNSEENAMMCMECEEGLSTAGTGATNRSDCKSELFAAFLFTSTSIILWTSCHKDI